MHRIRFELVAAAATALLALAGGASACLPPADYIETVAADTAGTPLATKHPRATVSVDFLLEACSVVGATAHGMIPNFDCESFLYGVLDANAALAATDRACVPADVAPWQVYERLLATPVADARRAGPAAPWVLETLRAAHPCP